jgi:hypothetical protein
MVQATLKCIKTWFLIHGLVKPKTIKLVFAATVRSKKRLSGEKNDCNWTCRIYNLTFIKWYSHWTVIIGIIYVLCLFYDRSSHWTIFRGNISCYLTVLCLFYNRSSHWTLSKVKKISVKITSDRVINFYLIRVIVKPATLKCIRKWFLIHVLYMFCIYFMTGAAIGPFLEAISVVI